MTVVQSPLIHIVESSCEVERILVAQGRGLGRKMVRWLTVIVVFIGGPHPNTAFIFNCNPRHNCWFSHAKLMLDVFEIWLLAMFYFRHFDLGPLEIFWFNLVDWIDCQVRCWQRRVVRWRRWCRFQGTFLCWMRFQTPGMKWIFSLI